MHIISRNRNVYWNAFEYEFAMESNNKGNDISVESYQEQLNESIEDGSGCTEVWEQLSE